MKRTHILLESEEYSKLEDLARQRKSSVSEMIHQAIKECYFRSEKDKQSYVDNILNMKVPVVLTEDWNLIEREIMDAHHE